MSRPGAAASPPIKAAAVADADGLMYDVAPPAKAPPARLARPGVSGFLRY